MLVKRKYVKRNKSDKMKHNITFYPDKSGQAVLNNYVFFYNSTTPLLH